MKNLHTFEEFLNEDVNEGATPRLLKSAGQNLARQVKGIKNYTEDQLKDRLLSTPVAKMLSDDEILTVLDHAKKELGMDEARVEATDKIIFVQESVVNEAAKEVVLSNEILDFLQERGIIAGTDAQKVHKDLTAFLKEKGVKESVVNEGQQIKVGTFVRYKKDEEFTGGKVLNISSGKAEISNWEGSTIELPVADLEYIESWNR